MIWGAMPSAGFGPLCFLKTKVTAPVYQEMLDHFMLPSADQLFKDADFYVICTVLCINESINSWQNKNKISNLFE